MKNIVCLDRLEDIQPKDLAYELRTIYLEKQKNESTARRKLKHDVYEYYMSSLKNCFIVTVKINKK
jgi:hypothetical protein